ncbi:AbgT family transporter [Pseudonocardia sp. DR1-2]|uniref:AbgT family transporter n=1 Tax=Pseudonocardia sp. DR1-2 TaxID=2951168 RepID=UPI002043F217|nr:AbgT family transporter [Pseudonocardia sp. DR1-2]MCM3846755.1 AbgT family transporter [Pseudonocardia sp. DR1-2]
MTATARDDTGLHPALRRLFSALSAVERVGNRLPHPFWLFWILSGVLAVTSAVLAAANVTVTLPESGETLAVRSLLSMEGVAYTVDTALDSFAAFPALPVVVVVLMGVAVAEQSGLTAALLRTTIVRLPARWVTFAVAFAGTVAHVAFDAAFVVLIPVAALAFRAVGRSPVLGVVTAYVSIAAGYNASPLVTPSDAILASITTSAARMVDPAAVVTPLASWYWNAASSLLVAVVVTVTVEFVVRRRADLGHTGEPGTAAEAGTTDADGDTDLALAPIERRALRRAGLAALLVVAAAVAAVAPASSPLRGEGGSLVQSGLLLNVAVVVALLFALTGAVYGRTTGSVPTTGAVPGIMADGVRVIAPIIVLFFAISQFLAFFSWTRVGSVVAVGGAELLQGLDTPPLVLMLVLIAVVSVVNVLISSGSAMWSLIAPIVVPMLMYLDISPAVVQTVYRIGDSCTNAVTPMSAYFVLALGYVQRYRRDAGIGTLVSYTLPIALVLLVAWTAMFVLWYAVGLPLGPGTPVQ